MYRYCCAVAIRLSHQRSSGRHVTRTCSLRNYICCYVFINIFVAQLLTRRLSLCLELKFLVAFSWVRGKNTVHADSGSYEPVCDFEFLSICLVWIPRLIALVGVLLFLCQKAYIVFIRALANNCKSTELIQGKDLIRVVLYANEIILQIFWGF